MSLNRSSIPWIITLWATAIGAGFYAILAQFF
jgi:hypothetical protein